MAAALSETRAAGLVIFRKALQDFEFLLLQHAGSTHHWTPPKGHVDPGESEYETAFRETEEESGLKKEDLRVVDDFKKILRYTARGKPKVVTYWLAELIKDKPVVISNEHEAYEWATVTKASELLADYNDTKELISDSHKYLKGQKGTSKVN